MARSQLSRDTLRALGPIMIPVMAKVAIPIALRSLSKKKFAAEDFADEQKDIFKSNLRKTRSDLEGVKEEAVARGTRLYGEARREGTEFLDVLARRGLELANEWAQNLGEPRVRRSRFRWGHALGLAALVAAGLVIVSRR